MAKLPTFAPIRRLDNVVKLPSLLTLLYRAHGIWPEVGVQVLETRLTLCLLDQILFFWHLYHTTFSFWFEPLSNSP